MKINKTLKFLRVSKDSPVCGTEFARINDRPSIRGQLFSNSSKIPERIDRVDQRIRRSVWLMCVRLRSRSAVRNSSAGYHLRYLSFLSYNVQEGAATEQHIIIGTVMAIISHGRFSPSPGSFSSLVGTAGQPAGRERMRMRNGVDWIKSSLRRSDAGQLHFLRKKFPPS